MLEYPPKVEDNLWYLALPIRRSGTQFLAGCFQFLRQDIIFTPEKTVLTCILGDIKVCQLRKEPKEVPSFGKERRLAGDTGCGTSSPVVWPINSVDVMILQVSLVGKDL